MDASFVFRPYRAGTKHVPSTQAFGLGWDISPRWGLGGGLARSERYASIHVISSHQNRSAALRASPPTEGSVRCSETSLAFR
jgi:hypothetical protein